MHAIRTHWPERNLKLGGRANLIDMTSVVGDQKIVGQVVGYSKRLAKGYFRATFFF